MILCILRSQSVKIPEEWNTKLNKYNKFMDEHYKATGCEPSAIRIRAFTHLDEEDVAKLKEIEKNAANRKPRCAYSRSRRQYTV